MQSTSNTELVETRASCEKLAKRLQESLELIQILRTDYDARLQYQQGQVGVK